MLNSHFCSNIILQSMCQPCGLIQQILHRHMCESTHDHIFRDFCMTISFQQLHKHQLMPSNVQELIAALHQEWARFQWYLLYNCCGFMWRGGHTCYWLTTGHKKQLSSIPAIVTKGNAINLLLGQCTLKNYKMKKFSYNGESL